MKNVNNTKLQSHITTNVVKIPNNQSQNVSLFLKLTQIFGWVKGMHIRWYLQTQRWICRLQKCTGLGGNQCHKHEVFGSHMPVEVRKKCRLQDQRKREKQNCVYTKTVHIRWSLLFVKKIFVTLKPYKMCKKLCVYSVKTDQTKSRKVTTCVLRFEPIYVL